MNHALKQSSAVLGALMLTIFILLISPGVAAHADPDEGAPITSTELIVDEADVLDDQRVVDAINSLERTEDSTTRIAVFTSDEADAQNYDETITATLTELAPSGVIEDGHLASDVTVVVISPNLRQIGVYSGVSAPNAQPLAEQVTSAMKPYAQSADWDNTAFVGASTYLLEADLIVDPDLAGKAARETIAIKNMVAIFTWMGAALVLGLVGYIVTTVVRRRREATRKQQAHEDWLAAYPADRDQIDTQIEQWEKIDKALRTNPEGFPVLEMPSKALLAQIISDLKNVRMRSYRPTDDVRSNEEVREWTDHPKKAGSILATIALHTYDTSDEDVVELLADMKTSLEDRLELVQEARKDTSSLEIPPDELMELRRALRAHEREMQNLIEQLANQEISPVIIQSRAQKVDKQIKKDIRTATRSLSASSQESWVATSRASSRRDDHADGYLPMVMAGAIGYSLASSSSRGSSSTSTTSSSSYSSPTTGFTGGGGFSGGSSGF